MARRVGSGHSVGPGRRTTTTRGLRRQAAAAWCLGLAVGALLVAVDGSVSAESAPGDPGFVIHVSGGAAGYLEESGCGREPLGGLPRRAEYMRRELRAASRAVHLPLEVGNFAAGSDAEGWLKTVGTVEAMNRMAYLVSGVGGREIDRDPRQIERLLNAAQFQFISTNLVEASTGINWLAPASLVSVGDTTLGILALTRNDVRLSVRYQGKRIVTQPPAVALARHLSKLEQRTDLIIVLAALPFEEARDLAREFGSIDLIVGTHGSYGAGTALVEGRTWLVYLADMGRQVARIEVKRDGEGQLHLDPRIVTLDHSIVPDPLEGERVADVLQAARKARLRERADRRPPQGELRFVGSDGCVECHRSIVSDWAGGPHQAAFETLREGGDHIRSQCVTCHVTGYDQPGGFIDGDVTPRFAQVGCESCHGPASGHLQQPGRPYGQVGLQTCVACHTSEMDPDFNYYEMRPLVAHTGVPPS